MGSIAVDPAFHPYGALVFVDGDYGGGPFQRLLVAQDTGGAIRRGPNRGDIFAGTGPEAGAFAERMNSARPALVDAATETLRSARRRVPPHGWSNRGL